MKKIHVIGIAFAAIFAFSLVGASGASAFSLWDQCTQTANPLEFTENDCITKGTPATWGWEEIKEKLGVDSLLVELILLSSPVKLLCLGFMEGNVGPGKEGEVTKILNEALEEVTATKETECELLEGGLFCTTPVLASPDFLPWLTLLEGANNLLESGGTGDPGWLILCANGVENLCSRKDSLLTVENLAGELEVDLGFKALEEATCTNSAAPKGIVEGTVSILLENGNALQAM